MGPGDTNPSPSTPSSDKQSHPLKTPNKHIIPEDAITVNKTLGIGEFGIVQQGVWTNEFSVQVG